MLIRNFTEGNDGHINVYRTCYNTSERRWFFNKVSLTASVGLRAMVRFGFAVYHPDKLEFGKIDDGLGLSIFRTRGGGFRT